MSCCCKIECCCCPSDCKKDDKKEDKKDEKDKTDEKKEAKETVTIYEGSPSSTLILFLLLISLSLTAGLTYAITSSQCCEPEEYLHEDHSFNGHSPDHISHQDLQDERNPAEHPHVDLIQQEELIPELDDFLETSGIETAENEMMSPIKLDSVLEPLDSSPLLLAHGCGSYNDCCCTRETKTYLEYHTCTSKHCSNHNAHFYVVLAADRTWYRAKHEQEHDLCDCEGAFTLKIDNGLGVYPYKSVVGPFRTYRDAKAYMRSAPYHGCPTDDAYVVHEHRKRKRSQCNQNCSLKRYKRYDGYDGENHHHHKHHHHRHTH